MSVPAIPDKDGSEPARPRRSYDSPVRRRQAAETRERILAAASELVHGFATWDWRGLTFKAVAERAGVGERTVYRYFPTERDLHGAVMRRLEEEAGVSYAGLDLDGLPDVAARAFAALSSFAVSRWTGEYPRQPALVAEDERRRDALVRAVAPSAPDWSETERRMAAAALDVLWHLPSYERLITAWNLDDDQATRTISWVIGVLVDAIRDDRRPDPGSEQG
ncbi:TetR/AcrR family transcriptional regulator [Actinomadura rugatobispora]|uniref:TetR/AcrR family transcriptional regulator n=1 Tax=Actinomadura rugatobispora TaxID=1994 RepID=A0ABW0ZQL4_9ACTN|nr:TetR/AcrR family transcriptional regulator [Actinomadura rugatobispora]